MYTLNLLEKSQLYISTKITDIFVLTTTITEIFTKLTKLCTVLV